MIALLLRPAVTYVMLLHVLRKMNSPESQICSAVGACSRHRELQISEINSDQGQISTKNGIFLKINSPTKFSVYVIFFCADTKLKKDKG